MKEYIVEYETEQLENNTMFYGGKVKHELIRCKDCRYHDGRNRCEMCNMHKTDANDYCSCADPKEKP